ncbi:MULTISPECIES: DUF6542 domain-containing protein [Thermomonospora]|uniref:DUF6542 domain-containing protein n=1 Tax=Thermomonospora curvata (strain ATCC 19995 / DSM 43183 / JCM 3096 / KCTC 9072 / NBRC 15933 / NCIMB 10081 / Henssen B9) TaxID=471852 RepID=D1A8I2_THECD|nr:MULTISPECIES: DUF6542 domain-containing protein [Thermomonospora]ACY96677.1 hypothetical protein Tcur_1092 [Thermomonospora curvata DSM 43183]PKK15473.1 MAG: hypothetical protein BUE48_005315 [Thermomonospora sp. CIF 1]
MTATASRGPSGDAAPASAGQAPARRGRAGRPARARRSGRPGRSAGAVTGRGGIVILFGLGLTGALAARWLDLELLAGLGFVAGCALAALTTRPADLLTLTVSPPLVFFVLTVVAETLTTLGQESLLRGVLVGVLTSLATGAPWLYGGSALVVLIAIPRGLPEQVRDLRRRLAGSRILQEDENADPVRWEESPRRTPPPHHGEVD